MTYVEWGSFTAPPAVTQQPEKQDVYLHNDTEEWKESSSALFPYLVQTTGRQGLYSNGDIMSGICTVVGNYCKTRALQISLLVDIPPALHFSFWE